MSAFHFQIGGKERKKVRFPTEEITRRPPRAGNSATVLTLRRNDFFPNCVVQSHPELPRLCGMGMSQGPVMGKVMCGGGEENCAPRKGCFVQRALGPKSPQVLQELLRFQFPHETI